MPYTSASKILSPGVATAAEIDRFFVNRAHRLPNRPDPPAGLGAALIKVANRYGINSDGMAAQCNLETDGWSSRIARDKLNPAGIGATNDDPYGSALTYETMEDGFTGHAAHLLTYVLGDASPLKDLDPRFAIVKALGRAGNCPTWHDLNGHWAVPGPTYGEGIADLANVLLSSHHGGGPVPDNITIVDIRGELETNPGGGPGYDYAPKEGVIIHYNGPAVNRPGREQLTIDASYHCHKDWSEGRGAFTPGDGIMYHYGVDEDGTIYLLRKPEAVLWHCGSWPENETYTSVQVTIGEGQTATPAQLQSTTRLVDWLRNRDGFGVEAVKGHQEVGSTACPGLLMGQFVYPYRAGTIGGGNVATGFRDDVTGYLVANAMYDHYTRNGGVVVFGRPISEEVDEDWPDDPEGAPARTMQYFERAVFGFFPENEGDNRVQGLLLGTAFAKSRGKHGPGIDA